MTIFDQMASNYDTPDRKVLAEIILTEILADFKESNTKILLDYGGGTGLISLPLAKRVKQVELLDLAENMGTIANQKAQNQGIKNFTAFYGDLLGVHPTLATPDIVLLSLVLLHISETKAILQAIFQTLAPGGQLIIVDFDSNDKVRHPLVHSGFDQKQLQKLLLEIGFIEPESHTFHQGEALFMNQKASLFHLRATKPTTADI